MKFTEFDFEEKIQTALEKMNFIDCTPIQESAMQLIIEGKDLAGLAQTGTGKTAAFLLPLMNRILRGKLENISEDKVHTAFTDWKRNQFILVLVPTRELAEQVYNNFVELAGESDLKGVSVFGGVGYDKQIEKIKSEVEFVIATPGRLIDLFKEKHLDLGQVRGIVFDEADRMFDMGFKDDMKFILQRVPRERQFIVFSATLNFDVMNVAYAFGADPVECNVSKDQAKADNVSDEIFHVGQNEKPSYLLSVLKKENADQVIIFSNFKFNVGRIADFLTKNGVPAVGISSLLNQAQRQRVMEQFKSDKSGKNILVATDVAARGLDVKGVDLVINYELPDDAENYVHRIGRTGRAGSEGKAFSLVSDMDVPALARVEDYLKHKVDIGWMEDADLITEFKAFPRESRDVKKPKFQHDSGKAKSSYNKEQKSGERKPYKKKGDDSKDDRPKKKYSKKSSGNSFDKKSGGRAEDQKEGSPSRKKYNKKKGSSNQGVGSSSSNKKSRTRPSGRPRKGSEGSASVSGKVTGFFKKLFGG